MARRDRTLFVLGRAAYLKIAAIEGMRSMSWHVTLTTTIDEARSKLETARADALAQNSDAADQFNAARDAVITILLGQSVGGYERTFAVTMSGHANPEHTPRPGWANDCVTVSVAQA